MPIRRFSIALSLLLLVSCSTQKNTWLSRSYNNLTARYNILFNGQQSFLRGEQQLTQTQAGDFTGILPLFPYTGAQGAVDGEMDRAIEKGLKLIREKSITVKPERQPARGSSRQDFYMQREFNRYVDDAYLLTGKAHLYKHEYQDALTAFDYVLRDFPGQPASFEALIWMARTRIEMGDFENARILLDRYDALSPAPARLYGEYMATWADFHLRRQSYNSALPFLQTAATEAGGKWDKTRRNYILAQVYAQTGQHQLAAATFRQVVRSNPDYETSLHARVNELLNRAAASGDYASIQDELIALASTAKNREFRDLLHFALAENYLQQGDTLHTHTQLRLSAGYNNGNRDLLRETQLKMAALFFEQNAYPQSFAYYDSSLNLLAQNDPRTSEIRFRHTGLQPLSKALETVEHNDSLLYLASLPEAELDSYLEALIEHERQQELNKQLALETGGRRGPDPFFSATMPGSLRTSGGQPNTPGQWYFYNQATVSLGKMEFERRWGRRSSEDNWRRSDKSSQSSEQAAEQPMAMPGAPGERLPGLDEMDDPAQGRRPQSQVRDKESLLAELPLSEAAKAERRDENARATFDAAMVLLDYFNKPAEAAALFETLLKEYPDHALAEQSLFWGHRAYSAAQQPAGAAAFKAALLERFPDGKYAPFLQNPDHAAEILKKQQETGENYHKAYTAYLQNRLSESLLLSRQVIEESDQPELTRKAQLLEALLLGKQGQDEAFRSSLAALLYQHPETREAEVAESWLAMLEQGLRPVRSVRPAASRDSLALAGEEQESEDELLDKGALFTHQPEEEQLVFFTIDEEADLHRLFFNLADYNFQRFLLADYNVEQRKTSTGETLIVISAFGNQREAMDYYYALRSNTRLMQVDGATQVRLLAGSKSNLNALVTTGDFGNYRDFFSEHYLGGGGGILIQLRFENLQSPQP